MPTYEYACSHCGHELEAYQSMKDRPLRKCPACKRLALRRKISGGSGLIFKGTGFYITDYKRKAGGKSDAGADKGSTTKAAEAKAAPAAAAN